MIGAIGTLDIVCHPIVTVRCFGWRVLFQSLMADKNQTFLSILCKDRSFEAEKTQMPTTLEQCIRMELHAKHIYTALAGFFSNSPAASRFFNDLAEQEQDHADLLKLCWVAAQRKGWRAERFDVWKKYLGPLENQLETIKASLDSIGSLSHALRLVLDIESSEVNEIFYAAMAASDSAFVNRLRPFQEAIETHISYIVMQISDLDPQLMAVSHDLWEKFPRMK